MANQNSCTFYTPAIIRDLKRTKHRTNSIKIESLQLNTEDVRYIYTRYMTCAMARVIFLHKKYLKNKNLKMLGFSAKLYPKILCLTTTPDLRVIFIIKLNLHYPSLSEPGCNTGLKNIGCGSGYKVMS